MTHRTRLGLVQDGSLVIVLLSAAMALWCVLGENWFPAAVNVALVIGNFVLYQFNSRLVVRNIEIEKDLEVLHRLHVAHGEFPRVPLVEVIGGEEPLRLFMPFGDAKPDRDRLH